MRHGRLFFTSQGRTGVINADGTGLRYFAFRVADQVTWQPGPFLSDGRRVIFLSMEARRDGPGRPFDRYYHQTPTHLWLYVLDRDMLTEIATKDRIALFYGCTNAPRWSEGASRSFQRWGRGRPWWHGSRSVREVTYDS